MVQLPKNPSINRGVVSALRASSMTFGLVTMVIGAAAFLGWMIGDEPLKGFYVRGINIKTNTAICMFLTGLALLLVAGDERPGSFRVRAGRVIALIPILIGLATLSEHLFGWDLGIDQLLFREGEGVPATLSPNRMGPPASVCFPLLGIALVLIDRRGHNGSVLSIPFAMAAVLIAIVPILGYVYGIRELYGVARYTGIALTTAITVVLVGLGVMFARPESGPTRIFVTTDSGGMLVRRLMPAAVLLPLVITSLRSAGQDAGWYDAAFGRTLGMFSFIVAFSSLVLWTGSVISRHERARVQAEVAEHEMKQLLLQSLKAERSARAVAEHSSRMKDEFLATLSHELRTPLQSILGWAVVLQRDGVEEREKRRGLETILRNTRVQAQLIEDLLDVSRIVSGKVHLEMEDVELPPVVDAALTTTIPAAEEKSIHIERRLEQGRLRVRGDAARLQQVLCNLIMNAIKFTPTGGHVAVVLEYDRTHAQLTVSDTGMGIPPAMIDQIFERFRQADGSTTRVHGGLGLGLAIARQITELHGGSLHAHSDGEGKGSTFTVRLPVSSSSGAAVDGKPGAAGARAAQTDERRTVSLAGARVLVVEDQEDARDIIELALVDGDAVVRTAANVEQALEILERESIDVLVSDIGLPLRDGYDLIRTARERGVAIPAIALTAYAHAEDGVRAIEAGYQQHLAKPVAPSVLLAAVERALGGAAAELGTPALRGSDGNGAS